VTTATGGRLHADARSVLTAWRPDRLPASTAQGTPQAQAQDPVQEALRRDYLDFLDRHPDAMWRDCTYGHVTASALVLNGTSSHVLLTLHPKVGRWLQVGGHCERADESLSAAALREAAEETGIGGLTLSLAPARLDRHTVRCGPGAEVDHLDVQFVAWAPEGAREQMSSESLDLRWWPVDRLPEPLDPSVAALVEQGVSLRC